MPNWEFVEGDAKSGMLGLIAMSQSQYGLETGPDSQYMILNPDDGIIAWFGNRGDGTVEQLVTIDAGGTALGYFGSANSTKTGVYGISKTSYGLYGISSSGTGVRGTSSGGLGYGGYFTNSGGIGIYAGGNGTKYSIYADTANSVYAAGDISALTFTDRP